jgi:hypothetical protein
MPHECQLWVRMDTGVLDGCFFFFSPLMLKMEPRTLHMLGSHSAIKLHPQPLDFWDKVSLCGHGWPQTCYVAQADLKVCLDPPTSASPVLRLQVWPPHPALKESISSTRNSYANGDSSHSKQLPWKLQIMQSAVFLCQVALFLEGIACVKLGWHVKWT